MLKCIVCGKVIANTSSKLHYGGCASCPVDEVKKRMDAERVSKERHNSEIIDNLITELVKEANQFLNNGKNRAKTDKYRLEGYHTALKIVEKYL